MSNEKNKYFQMLTISSQFLNYGYAITKNQEYCGNLCNFFLIIVEKMSYKIRKFYGNVDLPCGNFDMFLISVNPGILIAFNSEIQLANCTPKI